MDQSAPYIALEVPHMRPPRAWSGSDLDDFCSRVEQAHVAGGRTVYEATTPRGLAESFGVDAGFAYEHFVEADAEWIWRLGEQHGWDAALYRADYYTGEEGLYRPQPISRVDACDAAARDDLSFFQLFTSAEEVEQTLRHLRGPQAPRIGKAGPLAAAAALEAEARRVGWIADLEDEEG